MFLSIKFYAFSFNLFLFFQHNNFSEIEIDKNNLSF